MKVTNLITKLVAVSLLLLLAGCGPMYKTYFTYRPPRTMQGRQCVMQCSQTKNMCNMACNSQYNQCVTNAKMSAMTEYEIYRQDQLAAGKPIKRSLDSFVNTWNCNSQCGCKTQYNDCYSMCGGQVLMNRQCVAFCNQQK